MTKIDLGRITPVYKGNYDSTVSYNELDIVYDDTIGKSFIAKQASKGKDLPVDKENEYWGIIAKQGPKGTAGEVGPKGDKGAAGDQGIQGERGPKGDKGDQGPRGPQGIQGDQGVAGNDATFDENKDYTFNGTVRFSSHIQGTSDSALTLKSGAFDDKDLQDTEYKGQTFNNLNINYIQKVQGGQTAKQNVWISHVTGYTYVVGHVHSPEDTVIFECSPDGTVKSTMLIKSDGKNNIHGQNVVFDTEYEGIYPRFYEWYVDNKIRYSLYKPNTTINYLDMDVACIVPYTTLGHSFGIDFKNSRFVFWNIDTSDETAKKMTVTIRFFKVIFKIDGTFIIDGSTWYAKADKEVYWTTDKNSWIGQGVSAIPKHAITDNISNQDDTAVLVYFGSYTGLDNPETSKYQYEILMFESDGTVDGSKYMGSLKDLKNLYRPSVSQMNPGYSWGVTYDSNNNPFELTEIEAGNVIKTGNNKYGFTFLMLASKGSLNMEAFLFGVLDEQGLNRIRYNELATTVKKSRRVEPSETKLSNVLESGIYELSAEKFNDVILDKPQIFKGKDITHINDNTVYYAGITLENSTQSTRGVVNQKLTINAGSSGIMEFTRIVQSSFGVYGEGYNNVKFVTPWQYSVATYQSRNALHLISSALGFTEDTLTLKGFGTYVYTDLFQSFAPSLYEKIGHSIPGWFENSPWGSNISTGTEKFYQKYTTYETNPSIYIRVIDINPVGIDDVYTSGFGGGGIFNHASNWVKSN